MDDLISRQQAISEAERWFYDGDDKRTIGEMLRDLPSVQPKQNEMIKEIRRWINSGNRGNADYFIVDRIEEIINKYE